MKMNQRDGNTRLTLSITPEDKRVLKQAALDADTTVAALVHEWVQNTVKKQVGSRDGR